MINFVTNNSSSLSFKNLKSNETAAQPCFQSSQPIVMDDFVLKEQKQQKKKKITNGIIVGISTTAMLAIIFTSLMAAGILKKPAPKTVFKPLSDRLPTCEDDSVNPIVKEAIKKIKSTLGLKQEVIDYTGVSQPPKMFFLSGPTGTGKTFSAQIIAKEIGAEYGECQFADLSSPYIGETAVKIKDKFAEVKKIAQKNPNKKYVMTFNEIDSLINNVEGLGANNKHLGENRTAFLNGLDSIKDVPNLFIIGTTNINPKSANLDAATLSRFGNNVFEIGCPQLKEAKAAIKFHLHTDKYPAAKDFVNNDAELTKIAQKIVDKGGAQRDIDNIVKEAMGNFATDINKLDNPKSKVFTPDYLDAVIDKKDVWAATIKKENVQSDYIERGLNRASVVQVLKELGLIK